MKFSTVAAFALPVYVAAQYGYQPPSPASSSSSSSSAATPTFASNVHVITLGTGNGVTFSPNTVTAQKGDTLLFQISSQATINHGIVESNGPDAPCTQRQGGYDSGLLAGGSSVAVSINSSDPLFFFCPQVTPIHHCQQGMVLIVNGNSSTSIQELQSAASKVTDEATATVPQSTGVNVQATAVPSAVSGSSSGSGSGSGSGSNTSGAIKGSVGTAAGFLTAVMSLFFTLA